MKSSLTTALLAAGVSAVVATGAAVATTQTFTLGTTNRVDAKSSVTNVRANGAVNPVDGPLLTLANRSKSSNATPLALLAGSGRPPMTVDSGIAVKNLNADAVDGLDAAAFLPASAVMRVGPIAALPGGNPTLATISQLKFTAYCTDDGFDAGVTLLITSLVNHTAYAAFSGAPGSSLVHNWSSPDILALASHYLADQYVTSGKSTFVAVTGEAVKADGHQVSFDLYMGQNARGATGGKCIFGGTFVVK